MDGESSQAAGYAAATDSLRTATRWLLTAAAAAGAAMVAGLQLTSIGSLSFSDWPRLAAAGGGLAVALGAVGYMILRTSRLLADEWITLAQLQLEVFRRQLRDSSRRDKLRGEALDRIYQELSDFSDELYGGVADSITDLYARLQKANTEIRAAAPTADQLRAAADLKVAADAVVHAANYSYTRADFAALRRHLAQAGALFVAGVVVFAFAANPAKPSAAGKAAGHAAILGSPAARAAGTAPGLVTRPGGGRG